MSKISSDLKDLDFHQKSRAISKELSPVNSELGKSKINYFKKRN